MAEIALSVVQTLLSSLQTKQLMEVLSIWGYESELKDLEETIVTVSNFLLDINGREDQLSLEERGYVEKLKDAVYDADDLFDEVITLANVKSLNKSRRKLSTKVREFFSVKNPLSIAYTTSREVKKIRKRLDAIAINHTRYRFKFDSQPIRRRAIETCSYVYAPDIVGRDDDVKAVISKLVDAGVGGNIGFLTIVGVGGLGKSTLAQLVYNDVRVGSDFPVKLWVCVSDQGEKQFDVKVILSQILESGGYKLDGDFSKEGVQSQFQEKLGGKKCLLVLDDVWNEDCYKWRELRGFLMGLGGGSRVIVTSRSRESARIIGNDPRFTYELGGLSHENSWSLFELMAFGRDNEQVNLPELVEIGEKIVKQCCNVPLAIKVVGSLLYGQDKSKWRALEEDGLACLRNASEDGNMITSILKLSYDSLNLDLKRCFSYCALFPKGFRLNKTMLVRLWMSQGYTKPFYDGQSPEDAADEQFSVLLRRCFFQDVELDEFGGEKSCKIHDLMHDVAKEVAGKEVYAASSLSDNVGDCKARHVYEDRESCEDKIFGASKIRSYIQGLHVSKFESLSRVAILDPLVKNWVCLRALTLHHSPVQRLPDGIGKLLHLRSLDMYGSRQLDTLPNSITKLHNLETLILANCHSLKELPEDLSVLVNLSHLDIRGCRQLTYMPQGLHKLTGLTALTAFYVATASSIEKERCVGQLRDLKNLDNLKGGIEIIIPLDYAGVDSVNDESDDVLANMLHVNSVRILFRCLNYDLQRNVNHESLIKMLKPHANLKGLELKDYCGQTIPRWGSSGHTWANFLPCLVKIRLDHCDLLQELPLLSEVKHLRSLVLRRLYNLEYLEACRATNSGPFFPSLEYLSLSDLLNLKRLINIQDDEQPSFPRLIRLEVLHCPKLISFPSCPTVETLELREVNANLKLSNFNADVNDVGVGMVDDLRALPPCRPSRMSIYGSSVETYSDSSDVFMTRGSNSIQRLFIHSCAYMTSLSEAGFEHLTALESLEISFCIQLSFKDDYFPWQSFHRNLINIKLRCLRSMEILPKGMQELQSLRHLNIEVCNNFRALPEWIGCLSALESLVVIYCGKIRSFPEAMRSLTSLQSLKVNSCSKELEIRCLPGGDDWQKIQHIPDVSVSVSSRNDLFKIFENDLRPIYQ